MLGQLILLTTLLAASGQAQPTAERISITKDELFPAKIFLVYAVAEKVKSWEVSHVYLGPPELKGKRIPGPFRPSVAPIFKLHPFGSSAPGYVNMPVEVGKGLFWVEQERSGKLVFLEDGSQAAFMPQWSALQTEYAYAVFVRTAEVLEKIYRAKDQERLKTIDEFVRSSDRLNALTAIWQLTKKCKNPAIADYLLELSRDKALTIGLQIHVHEALVARRQDWVGSKADLEMIEPWLTTPWKDPGTDDRRSLDFVGADETALMRWLSGVPINGFPYSRVQMCGFAVKALANPARSAWFRKELPTIWKHGVLEWAPHERKDAFAYLITAVKDRTKVAEKLAAAKLLGAVSEFFSGGQITQLGDALAVTRDEAVARELRVLLGEQVKEIDP